MKVNEQYKRLIKSVMSGVILLIEISLYAFIWLRFFNPILEYPFFRRGNWVVIAFYAIFLIFFLHTYGGLEIGYLRRGNIIFSHGLSIFLSNFMAYILLALIDKKFHNPILLLLLACIDLFLVFIWTFVCQYIFLHLFPPRDLIVVYGDKPVFSIMEKINSRDDKYIITGAINIDKGMDKVLAEIENFSGVIIGDIPSHERNLILKACYEKSIRAYTVPKVSDILVRSSEELNLFDTPLLLSRGEDIPIEVLVLKRVEDLVLGTLMFVCSIPLFILFAIAIKCTDGGKVFYTQKRLTKDGKVFQILKFRTMRENAEKDGVARLSTGKEDDRITKVGKILRATRLDELPQLINILRGDMSLVGPRPERPEIAKEYEKEIPIFNYRLKMKAGLTGYAQIYGKYNTTPYDKLKLDLTYIRNYNLWLDMKLILMTPKIMFMKESTEGVEAGQENALQFKNLKEEVYGQTQNLEEKISKRKHGK